MCGKTEDTVVLYSYLVTHGNFPLSLLYIIMYHPKKIMWALQQRECLNVSIPAHVFNICYIKLYLFSYILCLLSFSTCCLFLCSLATCILPFCISSLVNRRWNKRMWTLSNVPHYCATITYNYCDILIFESFFQMCILSKT